MDAAVKLLLSSYEELRPEVGKSQELSNLKKMWKKIKEKLNEAGYNYTVQQVENKYRSLERGFKNFQINNNKTGRKIMSFKYEK